MNLLEFLFFGIFFLFFKRRCKSNSNVSKKGRTGQKLDLKNWKKNKRRIMFAMVDVSSAYEVTPYKRQNSCRLAWSRVTRWFRKTHCPWILHLVDPLADQRWPGNLLLPVKDWKTRPKESETAALVMGMTDVLRLLYVWAHVHNFRDA